MSVSQIVVSAESLRQKVAGLLSVFPAGLRRCWSGIFAVGLPQGEKTYHEAFPPKVLLDTGIVDELKSEFGLGADTGADSPAKPYSFNVTCYDTSNFCKNGYYAHISDTRSTMNLCNAWFDVTGSDGPQIQKTSAYSPVARVTPQGTRTCRTSVPAKRRPCGTNRPTPSTSKTTVTKTLDYAYGAQNWQNLAAGSHKPKKRPNGKTPCADENGEPSVCDPNLVLDNADTLSTIACGI